MRAIPQKNSIDYLKQGWQLVRCQEIRTLVIIPMVMSLLLLATLIYFLFPFTHYVQHQLIEYGLSLPSWLQWLYTLFRYILLFGLLTVWVLFYHVINNFIGAPLNGLIAEKIEAKLRHQPPPDIPFKAILTDLPRILKRELSKLGYAISLFILCFLFMLIPGIGVISPLVWFLASAWLTNLQYVDYPFDNHKVPFSTMRQTLRKNRMHSLLFGGSINLISLIPIINILIMPIAVCAATAMWVDIYADQVKSKH